MGERTESLVMAGILSATGVLAGFTILNRSDKIYSGPIDVPGVERVEVTQGYWHGPFSNTPYRDGNRINAYLDNGGVISVSDRDANYVVNGKDSVSLEGDVADADVAAILAATKAKAKRSRMLRP